MNDLNRLLTEEFFNIFGRLPRRADELRIRQLFDSYGGQGGRAMIFEMVHKYYVETQLDEGFRILKAEMASQIAGQAVTHRSHVDQVVTRLKSEWEMFVMLAGFIFSVGMMTGVCVMMLH
jgi:hypothetical protein